MKKFSAFLCFLCILSLLAGALAAPGDAQLFSDEQKKTLEIDDYNTPSMALAGSLVYTLWGSDIFTWKPGDETPVKAASNLPFGYYSTLEDAQGELGADAEKLIYLLVADGETLYGLNTYNGFLYPLTFAGGAAVYGEPLRMDWTAVSDMRGDEDYVEVYKACILNGKLYLLTRNGNDYYKPVFLSFALDTGKAETLDAEFLQDFTPYKDGKLLAKLYDNENSYNAETGEMAKPALAIFDPADGSLTPAGTFGDVNLSGLAYNADNDTLYYATGGRLMAMPGLGEAVQAAFLPVDYVGDAPAVLLPGGLYAIDLWEGLIVRNTDPSLMPKTSLSIYGGYLDTAATAFMKKYPDVPVTFNQDVYYSDASALAQAMVSGDATFDLYYFDLSYQDFAGLMRKGYCLDLTPYADLTDQLSGMYPFIQSALSDGGKFFAVPMYLYGSGLSVYPEAWESAGLTDRMPASMKGLIDFIQWWTDEGMEENPDIQLMDYAYDYRSELFSLVLGAYIGQYQAEGKELTLDTPEFRTLMTGLEALDFDALNDSIPEENENAGIRKYGEQTAGSLFSSYGEWLTAYASRSYTTPLVLPLEDGGAAYVPAYISCAFVNPNTGNSDLAVEYLRCALEAMDAVQGIMMNPDRNDPVPNEYYEETVSQYEELLAEANKKLETAAPEDAKDIQASVDEYQQFLDRKEDYYWQASADSIAAYRKLAAQAYAVTPNILTYGNDEASSEIASLLSRYEQQQITLDQFVTQADQKIRMIQLEGR